MYDDVCWVYDIWCIDRTIDDFLNQCRMWFKPIQTHTVLWKCQHHRAYGACFELPEIMLMCHRKRIPHFFGWTTGFHDTVGTRCVSLFVVCLPWHISIGSYTKFVLFWIWMFMLYRHCHWVYPSFCLLSFSGDCNIQTQHRKKLK